MHENQYIVGGNTFIEVPIIVAFANQPVLTVPTKRRGDGLECYLYADGEHIAVVRNDRVFPASGFDLEDRYAIERQATLHRIIDRKMDQIVLELTRHADRPTYDVSMKLGLPDGTKIIATPQRLIAAKLTFENCTFGGDCAFGVNCGDQFKCIIRLGSADLRAD